MRGSIEVKDGDPMAWVRPRDQEASVGEGDSTIGHVSDGSLEGIVAPADTLVGEVTEQCPTPTPG